jgi:MFS family permease
MSGLRLLPMMAGLFLTSITTGILVSRGRKYRPFPIAGTVIMTLGLVLLSLVNDHTSLLVIAIYMLILGMGIGLVMQILVTAVQNAVGPGDIGAATAGANFFRSMGGCFGTAVFGALYANELPRELAKGFGAAGSRVLKVPSAEWTPTLLKTLPTSQLHIALHAIALSIQDVYRWAIPFGVLAVALSLTLPEIKLRTSVHPVADEVPLSNADPLS